MSERKKTQLSEESKKILESWRERDELRKKTGKGLKISPPWLREVSEYFRKEMEEEDD